MSNSRLQVKKCSFLFLLFVNPPPLSRTSQEAADLLSNLRFPFWKHEFLSRTTFVLSLLSTTPILQNPSVWATSFPCSLATSFFLPPQDFFWEVNNLVKEHLKESPPCRFHPPLVWPTASVTLFLFKFVNAYSSPHLVITSVPAKKRISSFPVVFLSEGRFPLEFKIYVLLPCLPYCSF